MDLILIMMCGSFRGIMITLRSFLVGEAAPINPVPKDEKIPSCQKSSELEAKSSPSDIPPISLVFQFTRQLYSCGIEDRPLFSGGGLILCFTHSD